MGINWFDMVVNILWSLIQMCLPLIIFAIVVFSITVLLVLANWLILYKKGYRMKTTDTVSTYMKKSVFTKLLVDFPYRVARDLYQSDPDKFPEHGIYLFVGEQGAGKSSAIAYQLLEWQAKYPKVKVATNMGYIYEDKPIKHWRDVLKFVNGKYGVINVFDEMQLWFNSNESKDFPMDMLPHISQNRKNVRVILGTANDFEEIAKPMRKRIKEVRKCTTILGSLCIVQRYKPKCDQAGNVKKLKTLGFYFFVHDDKLRNCYDTYKIIDRLSKVGFKSNPTNSINVTVTSEK